MPPRLNKRQQRELEELSALGAGNASTSDVISDDEEVATESKPKFLMDEEVDDDEGEEEEATSPVSAKRKKKKSKKKTDTSASAPTPPPKNEKKAAKRAKAKEKKAGHTQLEQALAELSMEDPTVVSSTSTSPRTASNPNTFNTLLAVSLAHLDPTAEMRKFFGSKVVSSSSTSSSPSGSSRNPRRAAAIKQKSNLTRPQPGWWSASQREGLSLRAMDASEVRALGSRRGWDVEDGNEGGTAKGKGEERWWTVEYSQRYKSLTKLFIQAVMSGHPDALWEVQRKLPWHGDNLLQLAEVYRHREEYAQAVDFVDRALFTYERAFIGAFTFTTGTNRLDFDRVENRPFFLAIHRQIADLQRRGCTRTAFEFSRLLYALDPYSDPHGALFHLDFLAVKGGMGNWLVEVFEHFDRVHEEQRDGGKASSGGWGSIWGKGNEKEGKQMKMEPSLLPGWAYARALVLRVAEGDKAADSSPGTKALEEAIRSFPEVVPLLADKMEVALPGYIRSHQNFRVCTDAGTLPSSHAALHALAHMYTTHSSAPWKDPSSPFLSSWFLSTIISLFPTASSLPSTLPITLRRTALLALLANAEVQRMLARHIMVLEGTHRRLLSFLPKDMLTGGAGGGAGLACDPVPPLTSVSRYDEVYFAGVEDAFSWSARGRGAERGVEEEDERMLERAIPDREVRERVLQFIQGIRAQFPGGLREMLERLGPEAVEDILGQVQGLIVGGEGAVGLGGMPGAFANADADADADAGGNVVVEGEGEGMPLAEPPAEDREPEDEGDEDEYGEEELSGIQRVFRSVFGRFWSGAVGIAGISSDEDDD